MPRTDSAAARLFLLFIPFYWTSGDTFAILLFRAKAFPKGTYGLSLILSFGGSLAIRIWYVKFILSKQVRIIRIRLTLAWVPFRSEMFKKEAIHAASI